MIYLGKDKEESLENIRNNSESILANYNQSVLVKADENNLNTLRSRGYRIREIKDSPVIQVGGFEVNTAEPGIHSTSEESSRMAIPSGKSYHILHLAGPIHPDWKNKLEQLDVTIYETLEQDNYYLIGIESDNIDKIYEFDFVESIVPYYPSLKINPALITTSTERSTLETSDAISPIKRLPTDDSKESADIDFSSLEELERTPSQRKPIDRKKEGNLEVVLFDKSQMENVVDFARANDAQIIKTSDRRIIIFADTQIVSKLAALPSVKAINPYTPPRLTNNVASGIINVDVLRNDHHLDGSGQIVCVADSALDKGVDDASMLEDFRGRIIKIHARGNPNDPRDLDGHGTHVAGSVLGDGANANDKIIGMAPKAKLVFQSLLDDEGGLGGIPSNLNDLFEQAYNDGARIHTNSWGLPRSDGLYNVDSENADKFAFNHRDFLILFSAGNNAPLRVNPPGTAKNVLTVGASENIRQLPDDVQFPPPPGIPTEWGGIGPKRNYSADADNPNDVARFSCRGPTQTNRRKPDIVAPGTWILSTRSSVQVDDTGPDGLISGPDNTPNGSGDEDGIFTHEESVGRGLPGRQIYGAGNKNTPPPPPDAGPLAVENYCYLSGTSMATPIVAGACVLVRQYVIEKLRYSSPSAALLKAIMINGAVDMGMGIPNDNQGWGRVDVSNSLFPLGSNKILFDDTLDNSVSSGDIQTYDMTISSDNVPLAVTLVWRDPSDSRGIVQNRLHLRVIHAESGTVWTSDDIDDIRNNVQKVVINPPPIEGLYRIEVEAVSITRGIPELAPAIRQDYALVTTNANNLVLTS